MKGSGIYIIRNTINNKFYIGSAISLVIRLYRHRVDLKYNRHHNKYLQNSFNKYGEDVFIFEVLELIEDKSKLIEREQYWIDLLNPQYNTNRMAGSGLGFRHSEESKLRMSEARTKLLKERPDLVEKLRQINLNKIVSEETRIKMRKINLGRKQSQETIDKRISKVIGRINTEEVKLKMSIAATGKVMSEQAKLKMSIAKKGKTYSSKVILQYDKDMNFIKEWSSAKEAFRELNISNSSIGNCATGVSKSAGNFIWKFK